MYEKELVPLKRKREEGLEKDAIFCHLLMKIKLTG